MLHFPIRHLTLLLITVMTLSAAAYGEDKKAEEPPKPTPPPEARSDLLDYLPLNHSISIKSIRAGNHDESGKNEYFFVTTIYGLISTKAERTLALDKRKQVMIEGGKFGEVTLDALAYWNPEPPPSYSITGDSLRELTSKAMLEFGLHETLIAVMVEIEMFEKNKEYFFFGEDTFINKTHYFPIPQTKFDPPPGTDTQLEIKDDKGTLVKIEVKYEKSDKKK